MDTQYLEQYIHDHIPISKAMGVTVSQASSEQVTLLAPLAPNINHRDTVFGGSASAIAILAAWCLLFCKLEQQALSGRIVIHKNSMHYEKPAASALTASALCPDPASWQKLVHALSRNRMARISVSTVLESAGQRVGLLEGEFVILPLKP